MTTKEAIISRYRRAAQDGGKKYWEAKKKIDELKANEDKYFKPEYSRRLGELTVELSNAETEAKRMIQEAHEAAARMIKADYSPDGEAINDNTVKLLKSGIVLSSAEIDNLLKNAANNTMRRIIADYADSNGITYAGKVPTEAERLEELDKLDGMARSGLQRDFYYTDVIANTEQFDSVAADNISGDYTEA